MAPSSVSSAIAPDITDGARSEINTDKESIRSLSTPLVRTVTPLDLSVLRASSLMAAPCFDEPMGPRWCVTLEEYRTAASGNGIAVFLVRTPFPPLCRLREGT
uniref:Uncharacterized protein n=1 Tax=uncultured marine group II/III euryarchaeote KM3_04_C05 TaxID=1457835 RepID=A0A075G3A6_9EURY|nr:hypothetical protein [uncultured marine group II/III euryarchaeote KM3_04_C05]